MDEKSRLGDQLHRSFYGPAWHGPALREALAGVDAALAASYPLPGSHSIWELALHLRAWLVEVDQTLRGKPYESMTGAKDWPPAAGQSEGDWASLLASMEEAARSLEEAVADVEGVYDGDPSPFVLIHGIAQHNAYHAGQIALLKKAAA